MIKRLITRKKFITATLAGFAGLRLTAQSDGKSVAVNSSPRNVGNTGIMVSPLCFGAPRTNEESLIRYAIDKGMNFIDTGRSYGNGNNERLVGRAIAGIRNHIVIQSKIKLEADQLPSEGKGRKGAEEIRHILSSTLEESLKALGTDYIDILLYHGAAEENLLFHSEVQKFFSDMKSSGVIKAHGFSTHNDRMNLLSRNNHEVFYDVVMVPFNHKGAYIHSVTGNHSDWDQERLISILNEAGLKGIGVIAMKTCSGGRYSPVPGLEPCFKEAVNWVLQHKFVSSAAIAMAGFEQVNEHIS